MDLNQFKEKHTRNRLGINQKYGKVLALLDFGNMNYWYENDERGKDGELLAGNDRLVIGMDKLAKFCKAFSWQVKFYYGLDPKNKKSIYLIKRARNHFGKTNAVTKPIQKIKHYLEKHEIDSNTRSVNYDKTGKYIFIPKCNFDVEMCIDAIRLADKYDTLCLFSSDSDFASLLRYLRSIHKKIILVKGGPTIKELKAQSDLVISAQEIKKDITIRKSEIKKQKSRR